MSEIITIFPKVVPDLDIVIANGLAEEEEDEELPAPDVALLTDLNYGNNLMSFLFVLFSPLFMSIVQFCFCYNFDTIQMKPEKMRTRFHQKQQQQQNCGHV